MRWREISMRFRSFAVFFVAMASAGGAAAYVSGGSNLGFQGYPDHSCHRPQRPFVIPRLGERPDVVDRRYEAAREDFIACIRTYVGNAASDIARIRDKAEAAAREARNL
jgi:hypothetical protein